MGNLRQKYSDEDWEKLVGETKIKEFLSIPDIRNKLTPITNIIALFERGHIDMIKLEEVKKSVNYLADREVYKL